MPLIQNHHLDTWAGSVDAQSRLPFWIRELIYAVLRPGRFELRMPFGGAVRLPGFDGVLLSEDDNEFVPSGASVWEVGSGVDFKAKAKSDFEKRSSDNL